MNASASVQARPTPRQTALARVTVAVLLACGGAAQAQLVDGGFDINPLISMGAVIGGPTFTYGFWGQESSTLSTGVGINLPNTAPRMLSMTNGNNSGVATETAQAIDVSGPPWAALIAGGATFTYSALFNANTAGPIGGLSMSFYSGNTLGSLIGSAVTSTIAVDNIAGNWELLTITGAIPAGTQSLLAQVFYQNASLITATGALQPGFVDTARLTITAVPEPSTWAMMGLGGLLVGLRKRRLMQPGA